jgi:hypothetical protein
MGLVFVLYWEDCALLMFPSDCVILVCSGVVLVEERRPSSRGGDCGGSGGLSILCGRDASACDFSGLLKGVDDTDDAALTLAVPLFPAALEEAAAVATALSCLDSACGE